MTIQVAIKLPDELVARLDELVERGRYTSRSTGVRAAVEVLLREEERRRIDEQFARGFAERPDDAELAEATRLAIDAIEDEPWERWW